MDHLILIVFFAMLWIAGVCGLIGAVVAGRWIGNKASSIFWKKGPDHG